jgi:LysM repeat protein
LLSFAENRFSQTAMTTPTNSFLKKKCPPGLHPASHFQPDTESSLPVTSTQQRPYTWMPIPAGWTTIILQNEESSDAIAQRYGISVDELAAGNCWDYPLSKLLAGTSLNVPAGDVVISPTPGLLCSPQGGQVCTLHHPPSPTPTSQNLPEAYRLGAYIVRSGDTLYSLPDA